MRRVIEAHRKPGLHGRGPRLPRAGAWHLAVDRARLPISNESTAAAFRRALDRHGVDTAPWWDRQLGLCLLGAVVQFGWEKAFGDEEELAWWCDVAAGGAARL